MYIRTHLNTTVLGSSMMIFKVWREVWSFDILTGSTTNNAIGYLSTRQEKIPP